MPVYTLFSQQATGSVLASDITAYTMGVQFSVSQAATLSGIWFYSASGATQLPQTIALYQVSGTSLVTSQAATWSGAAGSGWVRAPFTSPPALTAGTAYKACVLNNSGTVNWYSNTAHYWDTGTGSGGAANGPLSAPNNAGASPGQDSFNQGNVLAYPASTSLASNYWVDAEVTASAAGPAASSGGDSSWPKRDRAWWRARRF